MNRMSNDRQGARDGLRLYLAAMGRTLEVVETERRMPNWNRIDRKAVQLRERMDGVTRIPLTAARAGKSSAGEWLADPASKPIMHKKRRH